MASNLGSSGLQRVEHGIRQITVGRRQPGRNAKGQSSIERSRKRLRTMVRSEPATRATASEDRSEQRRESWMGQASMIDARDNREQGERIGDERKKRRARGLGEDDSRPSGVVLV
ncbi:hypothetical protein CIHG_00317 [Coccidioides immitis H538.4]|nr:hypothetical protein CIRG_07137 [Coccidioides immitis RMSCC 2394]KMU72089.1 hypothetical protein CISG_00398 [Coccidioides immitis RMSCC 3703]KMU82536.1 hypothetical protein CIHG_00317 [Coccidioides immitis H538.4]